MNEVVEAGQVMMEAIGAAQLKMKMAGAERGQFWSIVITEIEGFAARDQVDPKIIAALMQGLRTPMVR